MEGPLHETLTQNLGSHITLICEASGVPVPNIAWLKDGSPIGQLNTTHFRCQCVVSVLLFMLLLFLLFVSMCRKQFAMELVNERKQTGVRPSAALSCWHLHLHRQKQWRADTKRLLTYYIW